MPQVDLESLVVSVCSGGGACGDRKIACETLADGASQNNHHKLDPAESDPSTELPPDFPPESFWLSKDAELDWLDRNAFIGRQGSTKGTSNSNSTNLNPNLHHPPSTPGNSSSSSHSQRFSNLKSMIGLPKPQNSCFVDAKSRRHTKPGNTHLFPKRSGSAGKSSSSVAEPGSPKVSCMGRVRSKRVRNRRLRSRQRSTEPELKKAKSDRRREESGFLASFRAIFKPFLKSKKQSKTKTAGSTLKRNSSSSSSSSSRKSDIRNRLPANDREAARKSNGVGEPAAASLGGMAKFSSGRRSAEWASKIDVA